MAAPHRGMAGHFSVPWAVHRRAFSCFLLQLHDANAAAAPEGEEGAGGEASPGYAIAGRDAVIHLRGVMLVDPPAWMKRAGIAHSDVRAVAKAVRAAMEDSKISRIRLRIDSPGGMVSGTEELATAVAMANKVKPVVSIIVGMCCSAAYWVGAQAGHIRAMVGSCEIGSIGVYTVLADVSAMYRDMGVAMTLVTSGTLKGAGADGRTTPAQVDAEQRIIDNLAQLFRAAVDRGRGRSLGHLATGETWLADDALVLGLIDKTPKFPNGPPLAGEELRGLMADYPAQQAKIAHLAVQGLNRQTILAALRA